MMGVIAAGFRARMAALPADTRTAWKWDMATGLFAGLYQGCVWTFVMRVARAELRATNGQMAWIAAAPALGFVFATLWARQMEGRSKLPFVYWTWGIARGLFILTPLVMSVVPYVVLVCLAPFVFSISTPAYTAIMKEVYPDAHRGRLMSWVRIVMNGAMLVTALGVGALLDGGLDFRIAFCVGGIIGTLSAFTFSRVPVRKPAAGSHTSITTADFYRDTLDILRRNPGFRWFSASVFVYGFGNLVAGTLYPIYQVDRFHVTNTDVAHLQNTTMILTIFGFFFWGSFLDRRGPLATVLLCIGVVCTMPLCYAFATDVRFLYLAAAAGGIAMSGIDLAYLNTTLLFAEPGKAAQYQALHSSFFGIRGSIAPFCAIPLMQSVGWRAAFLIALGVMLCGVVLQVISMRDYRRQITRERRAYLKEQE